MGMYDNVDYMCKCPSCNSVVTGFQSKDGDRSLSTLQYYEVDRFYSVCKKCSAWVEFKYKRSGRKLEDYELVPVNDASIPVITAKDLQISELPDS